MTSPRQTVSQFTIFSSFSIICNAINFKIINEKCPAFYIVVRQCFFFFALSRNATHGWNMLILSFTDAETLGSYHKVNSYYDYYM